MKRDNMTDRESRKIKEKTKIHQSEKWLNHEHKNS